MSALDARRFEIDIVCPRESILWEELSSHPAVRLHDFSPLRRASPGDLLALVRLLRLVPRADLIHAHSSKAGFLTRLAALTRRRTGVCVFTPHGWSFWAARGLESRVYRALERVAARWCRTILVVSDYERRAGLAAGIGTAAQYRVVRNGVDPSRFATDPDPVPGRIVMLGRLARQKRPDIALRAFARVHAQHPSAELHFVGDGPLRSEAVALAAELGLDGAVRFLGVRSDVPQLLARASCLLLSSDYEGCPFSVLEAMAAGVPVVATNVGGVAELVDEGAGLLVEAGRPDLLARAVAELLVNPERASGMGREGRRRVAEEFNVRKMTDAVTDLYREIASADDADGPNR